MWGAMMSCQLTLGSLLERAGRWFGEVEVVSRVPDSPNGPVAPGPPALHRYNYAELRRRALALAEGLMGEGMHRGDRVGSLMFNHYAHLEALCGIPAAGGVLHPISHRLHPNDIVHIINHAEDKFLLVDDVLLPLYEQIRERVGNARVIVADHTGQGHSRRYASYAALLSGASGRFEYPSLHENEAAMLCYTSGLAGSPRGVLYSHRALALHSLVLALPDSVGLSQRDVVMPVVPMDHANAWGLPIAALMTGCKQVLPATGLGTEAILDLLAAERVTVTAGVPSVWMEVLSRLEKEPARWQLAPGLRIIVSSAAPPPALIRRMDDFGIRVIQAWGSVETGPFVTFASLKPELERQPLDKQYEVRATQGLPLPFVELRSIGDHGETPRDGATLGEAQLRSPWVASSYYNLPELRGKWTDDGWFRTGDIVTLDPLGYFKIADRAKDLVKAGDEWISSVDLENTLMGHPAVQEAAVIAVAHPHDQERPLAAVVLKDGAQVTPDDLRAFLAQSFAPWQMPAEFVFLPQLPHTATGKLLKKELRRQFKDWEWKE
jgi:fatty-acyl-CoA synthase